MSIQRIGFIAIALASLLATRSAHAQCATGDEVLAADTLTPADIPSLSALQVDQIIAAVHESVHTDVTTIEQAFNVVDEHLINQIVKRDSYSNQFYTEIEFGAGDNSYGAIFYWGTAVEAAAIHDGFQEECGPAYFNYDRGDTAPECGGFLVYCNTASYAALDAYLPSDVAQAIVDARAVAPFTSVASVLAVNGVGESRLQQLLSAARTAGLVDASCSGIYDDIAVSATEAAAMVAFVNEVSKEELDGVLAYLINHTVINTLLATRPYTTVGGISATSGVGPAVFRTLRNAANHYQPFEELVGAVNAITTHPDGQVRLDQHFQWLPIVTGTDERLTSMTCFGVDPSLLPSIATVRSNLADGDEVQGEVASAVSLANAFGELSVDPAPGLADWAYRTSGHDFFGCYLYEHPDPWTYDYTTFFVDTENGQSILITLHYVE